MLFRFSRIVYCCAGYSAFFLHGPGLLPSPAALRGFPHLQQMQGDLQLIRDSGGGVVEFFQVGVVARVDEEAGGENIGLEFLPGLPPCGLWSGMPEDGVAEFMGEVHPLVAVRLPCF